jgi:hypothetical protein
VDFSLSFVTKQKEVDALAITVGRKAAGDAIVWIAYPKKSSKKYACEFNRDSGWPSMGEAGFEPGRMVAIDEELRFRRAEFIENITRPEEYRYSGHAKKASSTTKTDSTKIKKKIK